MTNSIKYTGWKKKVNTFGIFLFFIDMEICVSEKYKYCLRDIKQKIKNSFTLKLVHSEVSSIVKAEKKLWIITASDDSVFSVSGNFVVHSTHPVSPYNFISL